MGAIHSRQELADFMLRRLGAPVINIEVDVEHIEDSITLAIQQYHETHFDGITRDYLVHKLSGTVLTVTDATGFTAGGTVEFSDYSNLNFPILTRAKIADVQGNQITINRQIGHDKFQLNQTVTNSNTPYSATITDIVLGDIDNGWIACGDNIVGVTKILNITSVLGSSDYMFNLQYQIMRTELEALTKAGASMYWQTMNYLGHLDFIMKKEKNYTFNRRMNRLYLEINWQSDVKVGDIVAAEVYKAIDEEEFKEVYDDIWLKKYATALLKKQWGSNIKKYSGMQLPGGLTYNGQTIYDEAVKECDDLETEAIYSSSPLDFMCG